MMLGEPTDSNGSGAPLRAGLASPGLCGGLRSVIANAIPAGIGQTPNGKKRQKAGRGGAIPKARASAVTALDGGGRRLLDLRGFAKCDAVLQTIPLG
jgi:hypothetical protein